MSPPQNNRDDLILQRLDQLHDEVMQIRSGLRDDMREYVLKAIYDSQVVELKETDKSQEEHLNRLEERVLSQGQRTLINVCSLIGAAGGLVGLLHLLHLL